jgi:BclB C-terminal domain-containing protein
MGSNGAYASGGGTIDLSGAVGLQLNFAGSLPRSVVIDKISAFFSLVALSVGLGLDTVALTVQVYTAPTASNTFTALGSPISMGSLSGVPPLGTTRTALATGLNLAVPAEHRILVVFAASGTTVLTTVNAYLSAGINVI